MSSIYPEKIAMYFSSMSPLSAKIFADIQAVEETVKIDDSLSYNEKSKIIDKHLIHDKIHRNKKKQQQLRAIEKGEVVQDNDEDDIPANQIFYDDPELDKDQVTALLLSVYPKKPEKYVYEDNSFYLDEHSEPFNYCTQSQASFCQLEQLVKSLPLPRISIQSSFQSKKSDSKSRIGTGSHREKKQPAPLPKNPAPPPIRLSDEDAQKNSKDQTTTRPQHKQTMFSGLGVPLMGMGVMPSSKNEKKYKHSLENNIDDGSSICRGNKDSNKSQEDEDSNLPQQVQNSDLIAELKLKMNKAKSTVPQTTAPTTAIVPKVRSGQVSKPKAPPPPPPSTSKVAAVKVCESLQTSLNSNNQNQNSSTPDSSVKSMPKAQSPRTGNARNNSSNEPEVGNAVAAKEQCDEFFVDVSSPCRIVSKITVSNSLQKMYSTFIIIGQDEQSKVLETISVH